MQLLKLQVFFDEGEYGFSESSKSLSLIEKLSSLLIKVTFGSNGRKSCMLFGFIFKI